MSFEALHTGAACTCLPLSMGGPYLEIVSHHRAPFKDCLAPRLTFCTTLEIFAHLFPRNQGQNLILIATYGQLGAAHSCGLTAHPLYHSSTLSSLQQLSGDSAVRYLCNRLLFIWHLPCIIVATASFNLDCLVTGKLSIHVSAMYNLKKKQNNTSAMM